MSPVAIASPASASPPASTPQKVSTTPMLASTPTPTPVISSDVLEIPRRPSPWTDLAHSLSTTSLPHRRASTASTPPSILSTPPESPLTKETPLSSSALREWEARLSNPAGSYSRHTLLPPHSPLPTDSPSLVPKLVPERDKDGHIEYKLKLIDPTSERFERLVTQMMWRLKQGGNEAIYELGLADDGTVIGLTRTEMDSSLRTLELMASEVGATVLVLKEIVLARDPIPGLSPSLSHSQSPGTGWIVQPPNSYLHRASDRDLRHDGNDIPKKTKRRERRHGGVVGRRRDRIRYEWMKGGKEHEPNKERQIVFDPNDMASAENEDEDEIQDHDQDEDDGDGIKSGNACYHGSGRASEHGSGGDTSDEDVPPFTLDLEDSPQPNTSGTAHRHIVELEDPSASALSPTHLTWRHRRRDSPKVNDEEKLERSRKAEIKARKSMERSEKRRLDLLRGDGRSPLPFDLPSRPGVQGADAAIPGSGSSDSATPNNDQSAPPVVSRMLQLPHQPARPSSLRLASPPPSSSPENDPLLDDLLHLPLDSLSLSFADVRTVTAGSSPSSISTEYADWRDDSHRVVDGTELGDAAVITGTATREDELICVEALVVRKAGLEEEEGWSFGGEEDGWGFGGGDEWE